MDTGAVCTVRYFSDSYARWADGKCPCCASEICDWEWDGQVYEPQAIGEGVMMCGRCIGNNHHEETGFIPMMLEAISSGARRKRAEPRR